MISDDHLLWQPRGKVLPGPDALQTITAKAMDLSAHCLPAPAFFQGPSIQRKTYRLFHACPLPLPLALPTVSFYSFSLLVLPPDQSLVLSHGSPVPGISLLSSMETGEGET